MLTPEEILDKKFEKGRGYDKKEVDDFLQEIYDSYAEMSKKVVLYEDQIRTLNGGLQHYKTIESSLQKALILAEKTADETIQTARLKADSIIREAENKAASFTADSHSELESIHGKTIGLMQEYVKYKAQFNKLIQEQLDLLNGSHFEIQLDDLKAFQKISEDTEDLSDTIPIPESALETTTTMPKVNFSDIEERDTNYVSSIPQSAPRERVESVKADGISEMNNLDYLNAAEKFNESELNNKED